MYFHFQTTCKIKASVIKGVDMLKDVTDLP